MTIGWSLVTDDDARWVRPQATGAVAHAVVGAVDVDYSYPGFDSDVLDGLAELDLHERISLTFGQVDGGTWRIVDDQDPARPPNVYRGVAALPWASGRAQASVRPHALVIGDVGALQRERLADQVEAAVVDVHRIWPEPTWHGAVVVYAITDPAFVTEWFTTGSGGPFSRIVTVGGDGDVANPEGVLAPRLLVTEKLIKGGEPEVGRQLRRDLTAIARIRQTPIFGPGWTETGAVEYTAHRGGGARVSAKAAMRAFGPGPALVRAIRRGTWAPRLEVESLEFDPTIDADRAAAAQADAFLACLYVADRYGDVALRQLVDAASAEPVVDTAANEARALRTVLHTDRKHFVAALRTWATTAVG
jgi:hypothetical protein